MIANMEQAEDDVSLTPTVVTPKDIKRRILSLEERVEVLKKLDQGMTCRAVAVLFGCGKTQVSSIQAHREAIMTEWAAGTRSDLKYIKRRKAVYEDLNNKVWEWLCLARSNNVPVSGVMIKDKALRLSLEMERDDFKASNGWLESFLKRYNVSLSALSGETSEIPQNVIDWAQRIPDIVAGYSASSIFSAHAKWLSQMTPNTPSDTPAKSPKKRKQLPWPIKLKRASGSNPEDLLLQPQGEKLQGRTEMKVEEEEVSSGQPQTSIITSEVARSHVREILDFAVDAKDPNLIQAAHQLHSVLDEFHLKQSKKPAILTPITDYFRPKKESDTVPNHVSSRDVGEIMVLNEADSHP